MFFFKKKSELMQIHDSHNIKVVNTNKISMTDFYFSLRFQYDLQDTMKKYYILSNTPETTGFHVL